ncbi:PLP-dependent aminotransferase family protein [Methanoregula sp. UBA64]|uniref:aminotransferase-like domain-containing protein n=1 Tax=Methanoregula sp. UBA64 TaxID=1915554 RepID=UPI0025D36BF4|nr:PLP-dependent aminotransferase family protein [Methanoregula sp. UBA64]
MQKTPKSFIREILKVTENPDIISFAGGLPNPELIDVDGIARAAKEVFEKDGRVALQYSTTEGYLPLRRFIADRYKKRLGMDISPDEILITNGSQQCLDLIGKILINPGDRVAIERPGYLGAIQVFSLYEPVFVPIDLKEDGPDPEAFKAAICQESPRLFYCIPNSQNPSGITYSIKQRQACAEILKERRTLVVEDDAYGELQFSGTANPPFKKLLPDQTILTGSFSKIFSPGMRMGWVCAPKKIMEQLVIAKQASDLHSNYLSQRIASQYLENNDIDAHIRKIRDAYSSQRDCMVDALKEEMPAGITWTCPEGGMFVWVTLPAGLSAMDVFSAALKEQVAVLPGIPFYVDGGGTDTLRLNFSNSNPERIREGVRRLGKVIRSFR